jgi:hypothetical protein
MSQLTLPWDGVESPSSSPITDSPQPSICLAPKINVAAGRCRNAATALEKHITAKHDSANRMLALPPTRKRLQDANGLRREGIRLARIQRTLLKLAGMHEDGSILPELASLVTRASVERALFSQSPKGAIHLIYESTDLSESGVELALRLEREAMLLKIPGFFPTPAAVATELLTFAALEKPALILEPSAGSGCLIDAIRKQHPAAGISYCELNCFLLDLLRAKYERTETIHFIGRDFLELDIAHFELRFDGILLNPPFENREDIDHVSHGYKLLARKGVLAAIISEGSFSRTDRKTLAFREFLGARNAQVIALPSGSFRSSGTQVAARMIRIAAHS